MCSVEELGSGPIYIIWLQTVGQPARSAQLVKIILNVDVSPCTRKHSSVKIVFQQTWDETLPQLRGGGRYHTEGLISSEHRTLRIQARIRRRIQGSRLDRHHPVVQAVGCIRGNGRPAGFQKSRDPISSGSIYFALPRRCKRQIFRRRIGISSTKARQFAPRDCLIFWRRDMRT
jgi:hypothetical protein